MTMKTHTYKIYEMHPKLFLEGSSYMPSSETKKNLKQPNLPLKRIRKKKKQTKPKGSRRKKIIKIREKLQKDF